MTVRCLLSSVILLLGVPCKGQERGADVHFPYSNDIGLGAFEAEGRSVQVYRLPFEWPLRDETREKWGLKLNLPVSFGVHDLLIDVVNGPRVEERVRTGSLVPGLEFRVPYRRWLIKPFVEAGFGRDFEENRSVIIYNAGSGLTRVFPRGKRTWTLAGELNYSGAQVPDSEREDSFLNLDLGADLRFPPAFKLWGREIDISTFLILRHYIKNLEFQRNEGESVQLSNHAEIGFTMGALRPFKIFGVSMPRLGISYREADDLEAWRINFGFPLD